MKSPSTVVERSIPEFLSGGGEMGERIRNYDWASTSLGPINTWPQSLRTCVRIMLTSRQPIWIGWGKELIKLYNDPYIDIVGGKHPWALAKPASVVWKEIWHDIKPMLSQVMDENQGTYVESHFLIMERNGYAEETYYTFSYTPIPGDDGTTAGMICANSDDTERIISERQLKTLTQLGKSLTGTKSNEEVVAKTIATFKDNLFDFPFSLFYTVKDNKAILAATSSNIFDLEKIPSQIDLTTKSVLSESIKNSIANRVVLLVQNIKEIMGEMPAGAWGITPEKAAILPIVQQSSKEVYGFFITGFNPYRLLDEKYASFFSLIADQLATSFSDVHVLEEERKRAEALAEIDKAKTIFFSNISHEFRTPLTLLLGPIQDILLNKETNSEDRIRLEVAYRNALRMQKLVNTLLDFSRIEAGRMDARFSRVDMASLNEDLASSFRSAIEKAGMQLSVYSGKIDGDVYVDKDMWEKIVLNLVSNAFKYSKQGTIAVDTIQQGDDIHVKVSDTGIGIPRDQLDQVFNRFHRVENTEGRSQEGTGIGLALVKELVNLQGGSIEVDSQLGKGTTFTITLPMGNSHLPAEKIIETNEQFSSTQSLAFVEEARKWIGGEPTHNYRKDETDKTSLSILAQQDEPFPELKSKVILADDNADMRDYVTRLLSEKFEVIVAVDGLDAYEKMIDHKPELLLTDIMMPKLDGLGLLKKVRSHPELRNTPVIFLSARAGEEATVEGLDAGADDYLVKPFSAKEMLVRVSNQIRINQVRRETEQQFYQLFLQAPAIVNVMRGADHRFEFFHPKNIEIFGDKDFTGMAVREAMPELEGQGIFELLDEVYQQGKTITQNERQVTFVGKDGSLIQRYLNFTYQPWYDLKGKIQGVLNFAIDVTENVESRKKVEESEKQYKTVLEQSPSIFLILKGADLRISFANDPLLKSWDKTKDIIGKTLDEVLPELRRQAFPRLLKEVFETGEPHYGNEEKAVLIKNGVMTDVYYNYVYQPIVESDNSISGVTIMATDITEQVVARKEIEESENRFRTLAETLPQLIWMTDATGESLYTSTRWEEYIGFKVGVPEWASIVHPDDLPITLAVWENSVKTGRSYRVELRFKSKDNTYRWFYGQGEPIFNENGEVVKWIGSFTDIQDQKEIEGRLEKLVIARTQELRRSNEDLQQFAHVASHDLKEPVRKIKTFTGRLNEEYGELLPEKGKVYLDKIQAATNRMYSMIEGVLNYSTFNGEEQPTELLDLNDTIQQIEADLELIIQKKQATIKKETLPKIEGAPVLIYQLFYNLINNSLKFSRPNISPVILITSTIETNSSSEQVRIVFEDNGIGFDQDQQEKIFDTFTRLNSKDSYEGTGLGLALCKKIVERHHGQISALGQAGKGSTFTIVLPITQVLTQI